MNLKNPVLRYFILFPLATILLVIGYFLYAGLLDLIGIILGYLIAFWIFASPIWLVWYIYKKVRAR